jgi:hypothetical protein
MLSPRESTRSQAAASSRATVLVVLASLYLALAATPALAHPEDGVVATNYLSQVTGIDPAIDGVTAQIGGGDGWVILSVEPGHEVVVLGYGEPGIDPEPYLRVDPDGSVHVNGNSPATWLNDDHYADVDVPEWVDPTAEPRWQIITLAGTHRAEWHDHRVHWMSPEPPRQVRENPGTRQRISEWEVPILVDGEPVTIHGTLDWLPSSSPIGPVAVGLLALAGGFFAARGGRIRHAAVVSAGAGLVGVVVATGAFIHPEGPTSPSGIVLPAIAVVAGAAGAIRPRVAAGGVIVAAVGIAAWALPALPTLTMPLVFSMLPAGLIAVLVPTALGLGVGAAAAVYAEPPATSEPSDVDPSSDIGEAEHSRASS